MSLGVEYISLFVYLSEVAEGGGPGNDDPLGDGKKRTLGSISLFIRVPANNHFRAPSEQRNDSRRSCRMFGS